MPSGAAISKSSKRLTVKTHGSSLRLHHLWLPAPLGLMTLRSFLSRNPAEDSQEGGTEETDAKLSIVIENTNESTTQSNLGVSERILRALGLSSTKEVCSGNDERKQE